jgi:hypothetical protein
MSSLPEIHYLNVAPKKHTAEGIVLVISLALLFVLLTVLLGHPKPPPPATDAMPGHVSSLAHSR